MADTGTTRELERNELADISRSPTYLKVGWTLRQPCDVRHQLSRTTRRV